MKTIVLQNKTRETNDGQTWSIEAVGPDGPAKDQLKEAIRGLQYHPAKAARRSLIDMMALIEESGMEIKYSEHFLDENEGDCWLFILQGR